MSKRDPKCPSSHPPWSTLSRTHPPAPSPSWRRLSEPHPGTLGTPPLGLLPLRFIIHLPLENPCPLRLPGTPPPLKNSSSRAAPLRFVSEPPFDLPRSSAISAARGHHPRGVQQIDAVLEAKTDRPKPEKSGFPK